LNGFALPVDFGWFVLTEFEEIKVHIRVTSEASCLRVYSMTGDW